MGKQLLDQYVDRSSIKSDTDFFITEAEKVFEAINKLRTSGLSAESTKSFKSIADGLKEVEKAQADLNKTLNDGAKASQQQTNENNKLNESKRKQKKATEELLSAEEKSAKTELESIKNKKLLTKYQNELAKEQEKLAKAQEKATKEAEKANNAYEVMKKQYNTASNASKKRGAELLVEANGNSKLYQQLLATDKEYQQATQDAMRYYQQLDLLENSVGQAQRRVGQYERAQFALNQVLREAPSFVNSVQTGFMAISNNLPILVDEFNRVKNATGSTGQAFKVMLGGLFSWNTAMLVGITLLTAYGKEIGIWINQLFKGKDIFSEFAERMKAHNEIMSNANKSYADGAAKLELLRKVLTDHNRPLSERNAALQQYNEIADEGNKIDETQIDNIGLINERITSQIELIKKRAIATGAEQYLAKKAQELFDAQLKAEEKVNSRNQAVGGKNGNLTGWRPAGQSQDGFNRQMSSSATLQQYKDGIRAQIAADDEVILKQKEFNAAIQASLDLIDLTVIKIDNIKTSATINGSKNNKADEFNKWLQSFWYEYQQSIKEMISMGSSFDKQMADQNQKRLDDNIKNMQDGLKKQTDAIEKSRNKELLSLEEYYATGEMTDEKYKQRKLEINDVYDTKLLEQEVDYYEKLIAFLKQEGMDVTDAEAKLYATRLKMQKAFNKKRDELLDEQNKSDRDKAKEQGKEIEKAGQETLKTFKQLREQLINELRSSMAALVSGYFERQKNQLQDQIDKTEELKKADIDRINASTDTEEKKAARIAIVQAKADAQKAQLEQRQRRADEQKARFERMFALAQIGQNTAMEATKYSGNPLKVAMIIAIGVAQAARVLATPIPKYRFGTEYHKGGPAIVGDGGVPEVVTMPDNTSYTTPDKSTLTYLPKGAKVTPSVDEYLAKMPVPLPYIMQMKSGSSNNAETMMKKGFASVVNAINSKRETHISGTHSGVAAVIKNGNAWLKYVNDQTNF